MVGFKPISHLCSPSPHFWLLKSEFFEDFGVFELPFWVQIPKFTRFCEAPAPQARPKEGARVGQTHGTGHVPSLENDSGETQRPLWLEDA